MALFFEERVGSNMMFFDSGGGGMDLRSPAAILGRLAGNTLARYRGQQL